MVQMFLYVDLMIACRISLEIKQCLQDLVSSLAKKKPSQFLFCDRWPSQSVHGLQSQMFTNPAGTAHKTNNTKLL